METVTEATTVLQARIAANRALLDEVLDHYRADNARLFGSVARGDARATSDVDVLVDLVPGAGNELLRVSVIGEEFSRILGVQVDVVSQSLLRSAVSNEVHRDAIPL